MARSGHTGNPGNLRRASRLPLLSITTLLLITLGVALGPFIYPTFADTINIARANEPPCWNHPFGLNDLGQDVLARVLVGGRISLAVGLCSTLVASLVGTTTGLVAGYVGGVADTLLMRLADLFLALPHLPLILLVVFLFREPVGSLLGPDYGIFALLVLVIGGLTWMSVARLVRASVLSVREMDFVLAAWAMGASPGRVILRHILPNTLSPVVVAATLAVSSAIVTESTLSFLGLGFPPDTPTWGRMLYEAKDFLDIAPHMAIFPALALFLTVLSINYLGDALQTTLDPRQPGRGLPRR
jgi:peptide/nickel transport system permease protein